MDWGRVLALSLIAQQVIISMVFAFQKDYWRALNFLFGAGIIATVLKMK